MPTSLSDRVARSVLLGPDFVARAAARAARTREERWMLSQPRAVRESYVREVLDAGGAEERWILHQSDEVRHSYVAHVIDGTHSGGGDGPGPR